MAKLNELKEQESLFRTRTLISTFIGYMDAAVKRESSVAITRSTMMEVLKSMNSRTAKENDRVRHVETQNANGNSVFLVSRRCPNSTWLVKSQTPLSNALISDDGIRHELWVVRDPSLIQGIESFQHFALYVRMGTTELLLPHESPK